MSDIAMDPELKARLYGIKLVALVREHFGDIEPTDQIGLSVGAAMTANNASWVLIEDKPERGLGVALAWAGAWSASVLAVLAGLQLPAAYRSFLSMWRLDALEVPVWVGEIGTSPGDTSPLWRLVWGYAPNRL